MCTKPTCIAWCRLCWSGWALFSAEGSCHDLQGPSLRVPSLLRCLLKRTHWIAATNATLVSKYFVARQTINPSNAPAADLDTWAQVSHAPPSKMAGAICERDRCRALLWSGAAQVFVIFIPNMMILFTALDSASHPSVIGLVPFSLSFSLPPLDSVACELF